MSYAIRNEAFLCAAALIKRYAANLSEIPRGEEVALECAAILDDAAELAVTLDESCASPCQELERIIFDD